MCWHVVLLNHHLLDDIFAFLGVVSWPGCQNTRHQFLYKKNFVTDQVPFLFFHSRVPLGLSLDEHRAGAIAPNGHPSNSSSISSSYLGLAIPAKNFTLIICCLFLAKQYSCSLLEEDT